MKEYLNRLYVRVQAEWLSGEKMFIKDTESMAIENRNSKQSQEAKVACLTI